MSENISRVLCKVLLKDTYYKQIELMFLYKMLFYMQNMKNSNITN